MLTQGVSHSDRTPAWVALCDSDLNVVFDSKIKPDVEVVSCLTQLTGNLLCLRSIGLCYSVSERPCLSLMYLPGLTKEEVDSARSFEEVMADLRSHLPKDAILVGHNVQSGQ